jgi:hypothetical protein
MAGRLATAWLRPAPDFIVIGAQKCGTTSLYHYLIAHPDVLPPLKKGVRFFDLYPNFRKGRAWYLAHFPTSRARRRAEARSGRPVLVGEATPNYLFHPHAPGRLAAGFPAPKLLVLLRNPVERALSSYHHAVRKGREPLTFEEAIDREPERIAVERERILADETYGGYNYWIYSYLERGIYADQLARWLPLFDRARILILKTEDLAADPQTTMDRVWSFLGLSGVRLAEYPRVNTGSYQRMASHLQARLTEFFRPHNERLYRLLGVDFGWGRE